MSGKKGSNRVKGNLKPSSSSQAANLLAGQTGGFIGFGAQTSPSFVPLSHLLDDVDNNLDSDVRLILRKLSKRDTTTKIKALQELGDACQQKDPEVIKSMLPFWPRLYNRLAIDTDYRVREVVQQTFLIITNKVKKEIAPYLKSIMGCWVLSQCDTYPTVASAAIQVFQSTFPGGKQNEALNIYRKEIFDYLVDNLVSQTAQTLSDPKTTDPEDMENKYTRILASSLLGCRKLIGALSEVKLGSLESSVSALLQEGKFWKLGKSTAPNVKAGLFSFLAVVCQRYMEVVKTYNSKLAPLLLHNLDVANPVIVGPMWEAVLSLVNYSSDCWDHISWQKAFWPKLRKTVESGCQGNASTVAPNIMPLLSKIPTNLHESRDQKSFYQEFLSSMREGLKVEGLALSNIECSAFVKSYVECCHYIINQMLLSDAQLEEARDILNDFIIVELKSTFTEVKTSAISASLYSNVGTFIKALEKSSSAAKEMAGYFWKELTNFLNFQIQHGSENTCERVTSLMKGFLNQNVASKKSLGLRFADENARKPKIHAFSHTDLDSVSESFTDFYSSVIIYVYTEMENEPKRTKLLPFFADMFDLFVTRNILSKLLATNNDSVDSDIFIKFFKESCIPWMKCYSDSARNSEHVFTVVFKCLDNIGASERALLVEDLIANCSSFIQRCIVIEKLLEKQKYDGNFRSLIQKSGVTQMILSLVKETCELSSRGNSLDDDLLERAWDAVTQILVSCAEEETDYSNCCVEAVLLTIAEHLNKLNQTISKDKLFQAIRFVTRAACSFFDNLKDILCQKASEELMTTLFGICSDSSYNLDGGTLDSCELAWTKGLTLVLKTTSDVQEDRFLFLACKLIKKLVRSKEGSSKRVLKNVEILLNTVKNNSPHMDLLEQVLQQLHMPFDEKDASKFTTVVNYAYITGDLSAIDNFPQTILVSSGNDLCQVVNQGLMNAVLVLYILQGSTSMNHNPDTPDVSNADSEPKINTTQWLMPVFNSLSISKRILRHENPSSSQTLKSGVIRMEELVQRIMLLLTDNDRKDLLQSAITGSEQQGKLETLALDLILEGLVPKHCTLNFTQMITRWSGNLTFSTVHTIQASVPYFPPLKAKELAEIQIEILDSSLSTTDEWLGYKSLAIISSCLSILVSKSAVEAESDMVKSLSSQVLDHLMKWREADDSFMISADEDVNDVRKVLLSTCVARFLDFVIRTCPGNLADKEWDMLLCCLVDWVGSIKNCFSDQQNRTIASGFITGISSLLLETSKCLATEVKASPKDFPENLQTEWDEFFSESIFGELIPLYVSQCEKKQSSPLDKLKLNAIGNSLTYCSKCHILKHKLSPYLTMDDDESLLTPETQTILNYFCPMLLNKDVDVQIIAFKLLEKVMPDVAMEYQQPGKEETTPGSEESCTQSPPKVLINVLEKGCQAVEHMVNNVSLDEHYAIRPHTEECRYVYSYMLTWKLVLAIFKTSNAQMRAKYACYLKEQKMMASLLRHVFCLLPSERGLASLSSSYFNPRPDLDASNITNLDVQRQAYSLLYNCLETTPALVRQWWMNLDRKTSLYVDKFTSKYVSPALCTEEISGVQPSSEDLEGITIKPRPSTREVVATYVMTEVKIVVTITLPENFPLGVIAVSSDKRVGASQTQWDRWLLQLNIFLQHQNGTIIEGLKLWKRNIDKRFDGVEDCMICFSVLHGTTFQLPKLQCRTCKKKYHSACLYKWFSTSMNSTCPLCRNLF